MVAARDHHDDARSEVLLRGLVLFLVATSQPLFSTGPEFYLDVRIVGSCSVPIVYCGKRVRDIIR